MLTVELVVDIVYFLWLKALWFLNFHFICYRAIELDPSEKIFYCNRAAAHSKLGNHFMAVEDCQRAIDMDPNYSKAYGRMGYVKCKIRNMCS